jgi:uncharacterized protein (DUF2062 family)
MHMQLAWRPALEALGVGAVVMGSASAIVKFLPLDVTNWPLNAAQCTSKKPLQEVQRV